MNTHTSHIQKTLGSDNSSVSVVSDLLQLPERTILSNQRSLPTLISESEVYNTTDREDSDEHKETINQSQREWASKHAVHLSKKQSNVCCGNFSCRHVLIVVTTSIIGCLAIIALILANVLLYSILPTLCKLFITKSKCYKYFIIFVWSSRFPKCELQYISLTVVFAVLVQNSVNQSNSTQTIKYANYCGGVSSYTLWTIYFTSGITTYIDTRVCTFNSTPLYFTTILGYSLHDNIVSNNAIYGPTQLGFSIYIRPYSYWSSSLMYNYSQIYKWNVSWVGIDY